MSLQVRDGKFDVVVVAGPQVSTWPSIGARTLSSVCAEMRLTVGMFGGDSVQGRGVLPLPGTGGIVVLEDIQNRIHRVQARAVVKLSMDSQLPDPFPGWRSQGLIPLASAERLRETSKVSWDQGAIILGTGNRALRFGSALLEAGAKSVSCIETFAEWGAKRFAGWEVERRRFEINGGRIIEAKPVSLTQKSPLLWEFRVQDSRGVRVLETSRVVSAGPFGPTTGVREYPPGSSLFEMDQTALATQADDREGWVMEEERGRWLAGKLVKNLVSEIGSRREDLESQFRRARGRLKKYFTHRDEPFTPNYQGKWIATADAKRLKSFSGVPQKKHHERATASIECFEEIPCNHCAEACPTDAIHIGKIPRGPLPILNEDLCTGCGACLSACPSSATLLIEEKPDLSLSKLTLPWRGSKSWETGEFAMLMNRRGESLSSARVTEVKMSDSPGVSTVSLEVPTHLVWEARGLKKNKPQAAADPIFLNSMKEENSTKKVEITFNGEKRLVRDGIPLTVALFETGQSRPEDMLLCLNGSCGLCELGVDGVKRMGCQTGVHRGMVVVTGDSKSANQDALCPCLGISTEQVTERMKQGNLKSPEAVISVTHVGEGKCHGQLCQGALRRVMQDQGLDVSQWIDWRFPWSEWVLNRN